MELQDGIVVKKLFQYQIYSMRKIVGTVVCKNLLVQEKLGTGSFGEIYLAQSKTTQDQFAIKFEDPNAKHPQLFYQAKLYKILNGVPGVPKVYAVTTQANLNLMVMSLLGLSLEDIFQKYKKKLSVKTSIMAGLQMLERIEALHERGYLHRDIKPDNFLVGKSDPSLIYMIDLGLAKKFMKDGIHIPYCTGKELTGTARYASINTHLGYQQGRRDDIQSIGYVIVYLAKGCLPWQNMKAHEKKTKYDMIKDKKLGTPLEVLCNGLPIPLSMFLANAKSLKFEQKPDYPRFRQLLNDVLKHIDEQNDRMFDWISDIPQEMTVKEKIKSIDKYFESSKERHASIERRPQKGKVVQPKNNATRGLQPPRPSQTAKMKVYQPPGLSSGLKQMPKNSFGSTEHIRRQNSRQKGRLDSQQKKWQGPKISVIKQ